MLLTIDTAAHSILRFVIMKHFIISQFALKSCHLLVHQSNDQISRISPCETTKDNVSYIKPLSSKKSNLPLCSYQMIFECYISILSGQGNC